MTSTWYKATFPDTESLEEIEQAVDAQFGGLCTVYRGENARVVFVHLHEKTAEIMRKQFAVWVNEGYLASFEEKDR
jgi:hypothetical protein